MSLVRVILLGAHHPHFYIRAQILRERKDVEIIGFWEEERTLAQKIQNRLGIRRFDSEHALVSTHFDVAFVHPLDHDNPRLALFAASSGAKGLFLEKPGATHPEHLFKLAEDLKEWPNLVVEWGWEMHYAETMDMVRHLVRHGALGEITTSHWHGGTPSGGGMELWQRQDGTLGGFLYMDGSHTLEAIVDVFGLPKSVSASVRKLPKGHKHPIVSCFYDMHVERLEPPTTAYCVGELPYEDIGSVILEYESHNVVADFTAWEPTDWCVDWGIDIYGTNGTFHGVLNPPKGQVNLRSGRGGFDKGLTQMPTEKATGVSNQEGYYSRQIDLFLQRVTKGVQTECAGLEIQLKLMKVLQAVYTSARERRFIDVS
ncbi:uncharacterized protein Z518_10169 [Rhinocladiella mackenziei CBS 650.93]|uniref:Gfo/Idh/MocA-like oxidoreductase C-terminal domain-containing protein n=1 Tax=Rhinocladiella mackenziei CBS 650.93 TaxID=1442369 RepID=A0A0D2GS24_9EURO|nr:uncharacterized protein Z518_10169 [Rhinocladiella mackenziei CBS 650.93]KIX01103.1 hypothetical protein Z518_10169 [Rhinocladiella mackenziei CBS 650.93]